MSSYLTDRSRIITYQSCNRRRYWNYEYNGVGIQPVGLSIPLTVGSAYHLGMEILLAFEIRDTVQLWRYLKDDGDPRTIVMENNLRSNMEARIDFAVKIALDDYDKEVLSRNFTLSETEDAGYVYYEQRAFIEALIRAWAMERMPFLLSTYEVLEVEREEVWEIVPPTLVRKFCDACVGTGKIYSKIIDGLEICDACEGAGQWTEPQGGITFMARPDGLLRHRETGSLFILSFKTTSSYGDWKEMEGRIDVQGLSELAAVEARLREWWLKAHQSPEEHQRWIAGEQMGSYGTFTKERPPRIAGIHMEYAIKGRRSKDRTTNQYVQDSFLARPWMKQGISSLNDAFAWKYYFTDQYGNNRNLGKSYKRVNIWEEMTIKEWVTKLYNGEVQPELGNPLEGVFAAPVPYQRNEEDVSNWKEQIIYQELNNKKHTEMMALYSEGTSVYNGLRNEFFPQYRHSCLSYGSLCPYAALCFPDFPIDDPLSTGLYQIRRANHQLEGERFQLAEMEARKEERKNLLIKPEKKGERINGIQI